MLEAGFPELETSKPDFQGISIISRAFFLLSPPKKMNEHLWSLRTHQSTNQTAIIEVGEGSGVNEKAELLNQVEPC